MLESRAERRGWKATTWRLVVAVALIQAGGCGEEFSISGQTVGLASLVRPGVKVALEGDRRDVFEDTRLIAGTAVETDSTGRAIVVLDNGTRIVVDSGSKLEATAMDSISAGAGRLWIEAGEDEILRVALPGGGSLRMTSTAVSLDTRKGLSAYVAAGELTWTLGGASGLARQGEVLSAGDKGEGAVTPADLWTDWTGGLAEAGPQASDTPMGIGEIFARKPGSLGVGRMPLVMRRHDVRVTIEGDLAVTETVQEFFNPASETLEGIYKLRIPEDAVLQRFAVDRGGLLVDGYIKEKEKAAADYQSYVYEGSQHDPALLEWTAPGQFKARIYPIRPGEVRLIVYRYVEWLRPSGTAGDKRTYVLPMGSGGVAPLIGEFSLIADMKDVGTEIVQAGLGARIEEGRVVFTASDFRPKSDFWLELLDVDRGMDGDEVLLVKHDYEGEAGLMSGPVDETYFMAQIPLRPEKLDLAPTKKLRVAIVSDLSAATDPELADLGLTFIDSLLKQLDTEDGVAVFAGDLTATQVGVEKGGLVPADAKAKEAVIDALSRRATGGATDLGALVTRAAATVGGEPGGVVIYVGDGFPTVGEMDLAGLLERLSKLPHAVRLYGVSLGDESNLDLLDGLCAGSGLATRISSRMEAAETAYEILADASVPVFSDVTFEVEGEVERLFPRRAVTLRANEPLVILGRITEGGKDPEAIRVKGRLGKDRFDLRVETVVEEVKDHGDLRLRWATLRLQALTQENSGREALVELGTRFQIITPYTSFYVPPAVETDMVQPRPYFEIFVMPGDEGPGQGGIMRTILGAAGLGLSLLPYGCSFKRSADMEEQESSEESFKARVMSEQAPAQASEGEAANRDQAAPTTVPMDKGEEGGMGLRGAGSGGGGIGMGSLGGPSAAPSPMKKSKGDADYADPYAGADSDIPSGGSKPVDVEERKSKIEYAAKESGILGILSTIGSGGRYDYYDDSKSTGSGAVGGYGWSSAPLTDEEAQAMTTAEAATSLQGSIDSATVATVSKDNSSSVRSCYEDQLASTPDLEGRVEVKLVVGSGGGVIDADVLSSSLDSGAVESCILAEVRTWSFPVPDGAGTSVATVPFNFKQGKDVQAKMNMYDNVGLNSNVLNLDVQAAQQMTQQGSQQSIQISLNNSQNLMVLGPMDNPNPHMMLQYQAKKEVCTAEADRPLSERVAVWAERLGSFPTVGEVVTQFGQARRNCEIQTMQDRRAFARLALDLLPGPSERCLFLNRMKAYPSLVDYIRKKILEMVKTPDDLATVRMVCDGTSLASQAEIDKIVGSAMASDDKIKAIKKLMKQYPADMHLKLVLLGLLEDAPDGKRLGEAKRFADDLRHHPYADDEVRTRVGEFYIRIGKPDEAKRCFSEIVEFAPYAPAARHRLGDLYRTYGWYEDAYRQYETLGVMVPSDESILILLAEAASLAGRVDEAVRLAERVSQTSGEGGLITPASVARLFNAIRLLALRIDARKANDTKKLKDLVKRARRAGVLRDTPALRIVLKWSHPDVHLDLMVKDPGTEIVQASSVAEEFGAEWFGRTAGSPEPITIEVVRANDSIVKESKAKLYVITKEGDDAEAMSVIEVAVTDPKKDTLAWTVSMDGRVEETQPVKEEPIQ